VTVRSKVSVRENQLLVESRRQLSAVVGGSMHSESWVLHYGQLFVHIVTNIPRLYNLFP